MWLLTSHALHLTLNGLVDMEMLTTKKFKYLQMGEFPSDRLEGEFGVLGHLSSANYYISYEQIVSSIKLWRLKFFALLEVPYTNTHENADCCESNLTDDEVILLDICFEVSDDITTEVKSALHYISEYVVMKEGIGLDVPQIQNSEISNFTTKVSRGLLKHPPVQLLDLSFYLYAYYDTVETKDCTTR